MNNTNPLQEVTRKTLHDIKKDINNNNENLSSNEIKKMIKETIETKQLTSLLKSLDNNEDNSDLDKMNKMGLNISDITSGLKDSNEVYKGLALFERENRQKTEEKVEAARAESEKLKEKLFETAINGTIEKYEKAINDLSKKLDDKNKDDNKDDPIKNFQNELVLTLLKTSIDEKFNSSPQNPLGDIINTLEVADQIKEKLGLNNNSINTNRDLEIYKLDLEDKREREKSKQLLDTENAKLDLIKNLANTIGTEIADVIGAMSSAMSKKNMQYNSQNEQIMQNEEPKFEYYCEKCNESFYLKKQMEFATCPYCGDTGEDEIPQEEQ